MHKLNGCSSNSRLWQEMQCRFAVPPGKGTAGIGRCKTWPCPCWLPFPPGAGSPGGAKWPSVDELFLPSG